MRQTVRSLYALVIGKGALFKTNNRLYDLHLNACVIYITLRQSSAQILT